MPSDAEEVGCAALYVLLGLLGIVGALKLIVFLFSTPPEWWRQR